MLVFFRSLRNGQVECPNQNIRNPLGCPAGTIKKTGVANLPGQNTQIHSTAPRKVKVPHKNLLEYAIIINITIYNCLLSITFSVLSCHSWVK